MNTLGNIKEKFSGNSNSRNVVGDIKDETTDGTNEILKNGYNLVDYKGKALNIYTKGKLKIITGSYLGEKIYLPLLLSANGIILADNETFHDIGGGYAFDKNHIFFEGLTISIDWINGSIYFPNGEKVTGIDFSKFGYSKKIGKFTDGIISISQNGSSQLEKKHKPNINEIIPIIPSPKEKLNINLDLISKIDKRLIEIIYLLNSQIIDDSNEDFSLSNKGLLSQEFIEKLIQLIKSINNEIDFSSKEFLKFIDLINFRFQINKNIEVLKDELNLSKLLSIANLKFKNNDVTKKAKKLGLKGKKLKNILLIWDLFQNFSKGQDIENIKETKEKEIINFFNNGGKDLFIKLVKNDNLSVKKALLNTILTFPGYENFNLDKNGTVIEINATFLKICKILGEKDSILLVLKKLGFIELDAQTYINFVNSGRTKNSAEKFKIGEAFGATYKASPQLLGRKSRKYFD